MRYFLWVKQFKWDSDKSAWLKKNRGISFEDILLDIRNGKLLDMVETPNPGSTPDKRFSLSIMTGIAYWCRMLKSKRWSS